MQIALYSCLLFAGAARAQGSSIWYSFYNPKNELIGYKDANGRVKIPPKFGGLTQRCTFRNIIAVTEAGTNQSYYLLKSGRKVALDSLYVWDMTYDYEQEGKIRFHDFKTDRVGFLNKTGKVVIPALFNDALPFHNGLSVVIHYGRRLCPDGKPYNAKSPCEHWYWTGVTALIDNRGHILADSIKLENTASINWYSLQISHQPADTTLRIFFKGSNHTYYSFINYEKEFRQWLYHRYLSDLSKSELRRNCFRLLAAEGLLKNELRKFYNRQNFLNHYYTWLKLRLVHIKEGAVETTFFMDDLNNMIYEQPAFKPFYTDCGDANSTKFPVVDVVITYYTKKKQFDHQEHISFLRTAAGYKLIGIAKPQ